MAISTTEVREVAPQPAENAASAAAAAAEARRKRQVRFWRVVALVVWLASWELSAGRIIDPFFSSRPSAVGSRFVEWIATGFIWPHLLATVQAMMIGLFIGASLGVLTGFILGRGEILSSVFEPFITAVYSLPKLALAPLLILWFGIGLLSKVVLVSLIVYFLVFYNTYAGVRDVDRLYISSLRIMGGNRRDVYTKVIMPSAAVWVFTGFKLAVPYSLIGAIVGELISSDRGLGYTISRSSSFFDTTGVLTGLTFIAIIAISINQSLNSLGRWVNRWKAEDSGSALSAL
jgi:NitT/TauT family transport system permease protein